MRQTQKHNKKVINKINSRNNNTKNLINKKTKQQKNTFLHRQHETNIHPRQVLMTKKIVTNDYLKK